jgi:Zn-dependent protease with chaperone function
MAQASRYYSNWVDLATHDDRLRTLVIQTIEKLPIEALQVASLRRIVVHDESPDGLTAGLTRYRDDLTDRGYVNQRQEIFLYKDILDQLSDNAVVAIVAHEFAHAWLNEHVYPVQSSERETEADGLAFNWGFHSEIEALESETE